MAGGTAIALAGGPPPRMSCDWFGWEGQPASGGRRPCFAPLRTAVLSSGQPQPGRRQLRRGLVASVAATSLKAWMLADFDQNAASYFHMNMAHPEGPSARPQFRT